MVKRKKSNTLRVLTIDGGGIKGMYSAAVLARLEEIYSCSTHERFDLIVGTSAGSIIAAALSLGVSAGEMMKFFEEKGPGIFSYNKKGTLYDFLRGFKQILISSKYSNTALKKNLELIFKESCFEDAFKRLCVTSFDIGIGKTVVFKTPHTKEPGKFMGNSIAKAVLASCSAPTFFPAEKAAFTGREESRYVDGGVWAENPVIAAVAEAEKYFVGPRKKFKKYLMVSVSAITDEFHRKSALNSVLGWNAKIIQLMMAAQADSSGYMAEEMLKKNRNYIRIGPDRASDGPYKNVDFTQFTIDNTAEATMRLMKELGIKDAESNSRNSVIKACYKIMDKAENCEF